MLSFSPTLNCPTAATLSTASRFCNRIGPIFLLRLLWITKPWARTCRGTYLPMCLAPVCPCVPPSQPPSREGPNRMSSCQPQKWFQRTLRVPGGDRSCIWRPSHCLRGGRLAPFAGASLIWKRLLPSTVDKAELPELASLKGR